MSRYPPPPGHGFHPPPPPPPPGGGFPPPAGHAPPPPPPGGGGFPPPGGHANPPQPGAGFYPPSQQPGMTQLNASMGRMSMQPGGAPPPPGGPPPPPQPPAPSHPTTASAPPPPAPGMFQPPPAPPGGGPAAPAAPTMFRPPPPPGGHAPPGPSPSAPMADGSSQGAPAHGNLNTGANSMFYQQQPSPGQARSTVGMPQAGATVQTPSFVENVDFSIKIPSRLFRLSAGKIPQTAGLAASSKVPLGAVLRPLAPLGPDDEEIATVQPGTAGIIRCKRCRTYINAFVSWTEHGRRWRCNICGQGNDCPAAYFCHLDEKGLRTDRDQRPELSRGVVEFLAPAEYMVRPPQEPTYFFVFDVSATAVRSGMLRSAAKAIKASLDNLPGRGRTKIGFITFDNSVHYYNLSPDLSNPQMLVVSDLKELFVPLPDNLLVNLQESRHVVDVFLDSLSEMFEKRPVVSQSCLGPALKAAFTVMKQVGGKMCVFQSIMPNLGDGALKVRDNVALMGTPNEVKLLRPDSPWYKETAIEFSRQQISVDMFLFPYQYMDLAALGELPKFTAGTLFSYPSFNEMKDGPRFEGQLHKALTQPTAFEAVMRIRCTKGMRITNFHGNFYIRGTDLLALPNCNADAVYAFDLAHDEQNIAGSSVTIQAALLYTSSDGERRIRVMTQALPVTSLSSELVASIDTDATCNLLSKIALESAVRTNIDNARMKFQQTCIDVIRCAKGGDKRTVSGYAVPPSGQPGANEEEKPVPENLELLPLYTLALMKNVGFRGGTDVHPDERVQVHHLLYEMWVDTSKHYIYPRMFSLHDMDEQAGFPSGLSEDDTQENDRVAGRDRVWLPRLVGLSVERLTSDGIFLLDNGVDMHMWVGRSADPKLVTALFGVPSLENVDMNEIVMLKTEHFASRVYSIIEALREDDADPYVIMPNVNIVREGDAHMEARFFWFMIEDRASFQGGTYSYGEFMEFVNNPNTTGQAGPMPPGPPGAPAPPGGHRGPPPPGGMGHGPPPPPGGMPPQAGMGMAPPPPAGAGMPPPPGAGPGGAPPAGMRMAPPNAPSQMHGAPQPASHMPPPPGPMGAGPPRGGAPPAPPPAAHGAPPPPPGGAYGAPPPPPGGAYGAPPPRPPPGGAHGAPPPPPGGHGAPPGGYGGHHPPPGGHGGHPPPPGAHGAPPPPGRPSAPPPPGRAVPHQGGPPRYGAPPPPPPRHGMHHPPPPPPGH